MLSCVCLGIGEAIMLAALAGTAGLGAHAVKCSTDTDSKPGPGAEPCCNHECHAEESELPTTPPVRSGMETAIRSSGYFLLALFAAIAVSTCAIGLVGRAENHDHAHDHGRPFHDHG